MTAPHPSFLAVPVDRRWRHDLAALWQWLNRAVRHEAIDAAWKTLPSGTFFRLSRNDEGVRVLEIARPPTTGEHAATEWPAELARIYRAFGVFDWAKEEGVGSLGGPKVTLTERVRQESIFDEGGPNAA